jgi:hypothetical protein
VKDHLAYTLAALIFGASLIGYTVTGVTFSQSYERLEEISEAIAAMPRASLPGESDIYLPDPGEYTIFFEAPSNQTGNASPELRIELLSEDGRLVQTHRAETRISYEFDPSGVSAYTVQISRPGDYRVMAAYPEGSSEPPAVIAFGMGLDRRISEAVVPGVWWLLWSAGIAVAVVIAALTYFRRPDSLPDPATRP